MLRNILIVIGALVVILIVVIAIQPSDFAIERSTEIAAPADLVYAHLDSPKALDVWSPWNKMDPKMTITHSGPESGVGASESWEGPEMGAGSLTITEVTRNQEVEMKLEFKKPMEATNRAAFTLSPAGAGTRVAWRMEGTNDFVGKAASLVMNMDEMVGGTFERGLADLKTLAEADAAKRVAAQAPAEAEARLMTLEEMKEALGETPTELDAPSDEAPAPPADAAPPPAGE